MECAFDDATLRPSREALAAEPRLYQIAIIQLVKASAAHTNQSFSCFKKVPDHLWEFEYMADWWWVVYGVYLLVAAAGLVGNVFMIYQMMTQNKFRRLVNFLLLNLCVCDLVKCVGIVPLTLVGLTLKLWPAWAGETACLYSPIAQTYPIVVSVLTHLLVALDRYALVMHDSSHKRHSTTFYLSIIGGVWLVSSATVLPLKATMVYYPLERFFGAAFESWGGCFVKFSSSVREANVASFVGLFAVPLLAIAYLHSKSGVELKRRLRSEEAADEASTALTVPPANPRQQRSSSAGSSTFLDAIERERCAMELDVHATQCMGTLAGLFGLCWTPLQCLLLFAYIVPENEDNSVLLEILFLTAALLGFCSTLAGPLYLFMRPAVFGAFLNRGIRVIRRLSSRRLHRRSSSRAQRAKRRSDASITPRRTSYAPPSPRHRSPSPRLSTPNAARF